MTVTGPSWVDHTSKHVPGLFPLAVERVFNQVVAEHALAVTTVTTGARYYSLHGLVADEAQRRSLDDAAACDLLRRCEVAIALATLAHEAGDEHNWDRSTAPHAADRLRVLMHQGPVDLPMVAIWGPETYIQAKWGVLGSTYRGAEMTVNVLGKTGFAPGHGYVDGPVREALGDVFDLASQTLVSQDLAAQYGHLCLCHAGDGPDSEWLRGLFTVPGALGGTRGQVQAETMRLIARGIETGAVSDVHEDLVPFVMCHPSALDSETGVDIARRWRGIAFRYECVNAWRFLWQGLSDEVGSHGETTRQHVRDWMADQVAHGTVGAFSQSLPSPWSADGAPIAAERDPGMDDFSAVQRHLAVVLIGAQRLQGFHEQERHGFEGGPKTPRWTLEEELGPRWVHRRREAWSSRPLQDFAASLADVLIDRAQRLSLQKTRFDHKRGRVVIPGRIHVRDDFVYRVHGEQARRAALRLPQLLNMGRQVALFNSPDVLVPSPWQLTRNGAALV